MKTKEELQKLARQCAECGIIAICEECVHQLRCERKFIVKGFLAGWDARQEEVDNLLEIVKYHYNGVYPESKIGKHDYNIAVKAYKLLKQYEN